MLCPQCLALCSQSQLINVRWTTRTSLGALPQLPFLIAGSSGFSSICGDKMCKRVLIIENESIGVVQKLILFTVRSFCSAVSLPGVYVQVTRLAVTALVRLAPRPQMETAEMPKKV